MSQALNPSLPMLLKAQSSNFKLLDLPTELQRMIFDRCYEPWSLRLIDNYWRVSKSRYFCPNRYCSDPHYEVFALAGLPPVSLSITSKHIYRETQMSMMASYTGILEISARSSHSQLPKLPKRISWIYTRTTDLILDERAFADFFQPSAFPLLNELTISCFPIFCPNNFSGRSAPLNDDGFRDWAKVQQMLLKRRTRKELLSPDFITVLDSQSEQWESDESVFCYLADEKESIRVVRERLVLPGDVVDSSAREYPLSHTEDNHICSRTHSNGQTKNNSIITIDAESHFNR